MRTPHLASAEPSPPTPQPPQRRTATRGPTPHEEYVRRVREALAADYLTLRESPLCELPGVQALARATYCRKIYPQSSALRALLDQARTLVLDELDGLADRRLQQVAIYLRLSGEHRPLREIVAALGLHARSHVQASIQPQALELLTDAFLRLARSEEVGHGDETPAV